MFTAEEVLHYTTFGFQVMRDVFMQDEVKTMQEEFEVAVRRQDRIAPYDGKRTNRHMQLVGDDTPFFASLTEDERLYGPARQIFGQNVIMLEWRAYQYFTRDGTFWHGNDGDVTHGRYLYGARYQFPVFEPVRAETGALRVIPGSHHVGFQTHVKEVSAAGLLREIEGVNCVVCEAEPGDVVAFDTRVYHATAPYGRERRVASGIYWHYPETPEEIAVTRALIVGARSFGFGPKPPSDQAGPHQQWAEWRRNKPNSAFRPRWEELLGRLAKMSDGACGYRVEAKGSGAAELVAA